MYCSYCWWCLHPVVYNILIKLTAKITTEIFFLLDAWSVNECWTSQRHEFAVRGAVQGHLFNSKRQERWSRLDFLFSYLRMGAFHTNFSITTAGFLKFSSRKFSLPFLLLVSYYIPLVYVLYTVHDVYTVIMYSGVIIIIFFFIVFAIIIFAIRQFAAWASTLITHKHSQKEE